MNTHIRFRHLAGWFVGAMLAFPLAAHAQQQVKVNGNVVCSGDVSMKVDPAGNLDFPGCTLTTGTGGGSPTAPVCTNVTVSVTADANANQTIASSCSNGGSAITGYTWTPGTNAPFPVTAPTTASFSAGPFPTAATSFTYSVVAHNTVGDSNSATVTVNVTAPGVCGSTTANATWGSTTYDTATPSIQKGSYVSYKLPVWTAANKIQYFTGVNNGAGSGNDSTHPLITEFAVSQCPGDFTSIVAACRVFADPVNGVLKLTTRSVAAPSTAGCALTIGQQYYFNVRNVDGGLTNTCQSNSCSLIVRLSGN